MPTRTSRKKKVILLLAGVAVLLIGPDGTPLAQRDSFPINTFAFTSTWVPGTLYRDNHGVVLPEGIPPGAYELWVALYFWQAPNDRLPVTDAAGHTLGDHVLLATITVESKRRRKKYRLRVASSAPMRPAFLRPSMPDVIGPPHEMHVG